MSNGRWYVLHAYSGYEKKVSESIVEQANKLGISEFIEEVSVPTQNVVEVKRGVRVNTVAPAQVLNDSLRKRMEKDPELGKFFLGGIPAGRLGAPNDIKGIAVLLASDASSWITGATIPLDGGNIAMNSGGTPGHMNNQNN